MPTTPNGITYPDSSGHTRLWEHLQELANDVDAQLALLKAQGTWTDYTPILVDSTVPGTPKASAVTYARWCKIGKTVFVQGQLSNTSGATVPNACVSLPNAAAGTPVLRSLNCGTLVVMGSSTPADQLGIAYMTADKAFLVVVAPTGGFRDAPSGAAIRWAAHYEVS